MVPAQHSQPLLPSWLLLIGSLSRTIPHSLIQLNPDNERRATTPNVTGRRVPASADSQLPATRPSSSFP